MSEKVRRAMLRVLARFGRECRYFTFTDLREILGIESRGTKKNQLWHAFNALRGEGVIAVAEAYDKKRFKRYVVADTGALESELALTSQVRRGTQDPLGGGSSQAGEPVVVDFGAHLTRLEEKMDWIIRRLA